MKRIILLSGYSGSGKSYIADILHQKGWYSLAFADELKDQVSIEYNINRCDLETQEGKRKIHNSGSSYRQILINYASDIKKKDINYFCKKVVEHIKNSKEDKIVISDMRYPHEYYFIKTRLSNDYIINTIRVNRSIYNKIDDISEHALDSFRFDMNIYNDDTLEEQLNNYLK